MIKAKVTDNGFEGILFNGDGTKDKVVIVMSGSNGGMSITRREAEFYHSNGIPALALALFKTKQTSPDLDRVPIDYIEKAIIWLKHKGFVKIGVDGTSKGSEAALLAASMFEDLSFVIARVPSYFVSEGLAGRGKSKHPSGTSCWSYKGKAFPFAPYNQREFNILKMFFRERELHIITFNKDKDVTPDTVIPVEKIKAPILLMSSENDEVWPSYESSLYIMRRLEENGFEYPAEHISYKFMSHALLTRLSTVYRLAFKTERNHPRECAEERIKMSNKLLNWIESL